MLAGCDCGRGTGRPDYAILTVLVRLGLRAGEVAALTLDDVNWRGEQLVVRGKGHREERMPLPVDVGEVIVDYLQHGRPVSPDRALFLKAHAPIRALTPDGISEVVQASSEPAGLPGLGAHRLRQTAATQMLRAGAALSGGNPGPAAAHSAATTAIYATIDHAQLVALVQPWPAVTPRPVRSIRPAGSTSPPLLSSTWRPAGR
jgi:integrase